MPDVTVYGTTWCGDCRRSKALLHDLGVEYEWVDISEQPDAEAMVMKINEGRAIVPTILFADGSHLAEPSNPELEEKIRALSLGPSRTESTNSPQSPDSFRASSRQKPLNGTGPSFEGWAR